MIELSGLLAMLLLIYAALHDLAARTVPNWLPVCVLLIGALLRVADHRLEAGLMVAGATFVVLFAVWVLGLMGGGDVKLWAASVLLIPPQLQLELSFFLNVFLSGGLLGIIYLALWLPLRKMGRRPAGAMVAGRRRRSLAVRALRAEMWRIGRRGPLPYACAISAAAILALLPVSFQP